MSHTSSPLIPLTPVSEALVLTTYMGVEKQ